jgi:hypothetical protein
MVMVLWPAILAVAAKGRLRPFGISLGISCAGHESAGKTGPPEDMLPFCRTL